MLSRSTSKLSISRCLSKFTGKDSLNSSSSLKRFSNEVELSYNKKPPALSLFPDEYDSVHMESKTLPGPKSVALLEKMNQTTDTNAVHFFVDYGASRGNYIVDVDGNRYLDVLGQISSLPIGYNHPRMYQKLTDPNNLPMLAQRPCLGILPPADWSDRIQSTLMSVAPQGLRDVQTMMCGSCSNENAFKSAFIWYQTHVVRQGAPPSNLDLNSCMSNVAPGSPDLAVLSFKGGFHGRMLGCMSATHSKAIHKVDMPAFDWPVVSYPQLKYPLEEHELENREEELRCLAETEEMIRTSKKPIAAMIIEPIQAEGGDNHASNDFFRSLRDLAAQNQIVFIVDEVQTGGGSTGTFWAHEKWNLTNPPDIVTFSKKMQTGGYFMKSKFRPKESYRIFNTWMGDPSKMLQLEAFLEVTEEDDLLENVRTTGQYLKEGLTYLSMNFPSAQISNVRGLGTYLAFDCTSPTARNELISDLRLRGVEAGGSGDYSIRFRPALIFQQKHADEFLNIFENIINHDKRL